MPLFGVEWAGMWMGPALFVAVSVFLWQYARTVFVPEVVARRLLVYFPYLGDFEMVIVVNIALAYFAVYFVFGMYWPKLRTYLKYPFLGAMTLFAINVFVIYPLVGRGLLGYRLPQGWLGASLPLFATHWIFARGLQFQQKQQE